MSHSCAAAKAMLHSLVLLCHTAAHALVRAAAPATEAMDAMPPPLSLLIGTAESRAHSAPAGAGGCEAHSSACSGRLGAWDLDVRRQCAERAAAERGSPAEVRAAGQRLETTLECAVRHAETRSTAPRCAESHAVLVSGALRRR